MDADAAADPDALFAVEPDQFVAARNALVKVLKQTDKARAAEVAAWKRPSATVWALNAIARTQPDVVDALFASAEDLKDAMAAGDAAAMRDAQRRERSCLEDVVRAATAALAASGQATGAVNDQRLRTTLQTAVVDDDAGEKLRAGRLDRDLDAPGFGFGLGDPVASAPRPAVATKTAKTKARGKRAASVESETEAAAGERGVTRDATSDADAARRAKDEERRRLRAVAHYEKLRDRAAQLAERAAPLLEQADGLEAEAATAARDAEELTRRAAAARADAEALAVKAAHARDAASAAVAKADIARTEADEARPPD